LNKTNLLRGFFWMGLIISLVGLTFILVAPGGISAGKLVVASLPALAALGFAWLGRRTWRTPAADHLSLDLEAWLGQPSRFSLAFCLSLAGFLVGAFYLVALQPTLEYLYGLSIVYLPPLAWWVSILSGTWLLTLVVFQKGRWLACRRSAYLPGVDLGRAGACRLVGDTDPAMKIFTLSFRRRPLTGRRQSYAQAEDADMRRKPEVCCLFPMMYLLSWATQIGYPLYGLDAIWQAIFLFANLLTTCLMFYLTTAKLAPVALFSRLSGCSIAGRCTFR
jgi:hypothetical protein